MNNNSELIKLYSQKILALAAEIPLTDKLESPCGSAQVRSPLCGSTIKVDVVTKDGIITEYSQNVRACALGQATAAIVGKNIIGRNRDEILKAKEELSNMLKNHGPSPSPPFAEMHVLEPAKEYKNRHASIMLALEATLLAFDDANKENCVELTQC